MKLPVLWQYREFFRHRYRELRHLRSLRDATQTVDLILRTFTANGAISTTSPASLKLFSTVD